MLTIREAGEIVTYEGLKEFLGKEQEKVLCNNTVVYRDLVTGKVPCFGITLHSTTIAWVRHDGSVIVNSGGYSTVTTKRRINMAINPIGWSLFQEQWDWELCFAGGPSVPFEDMIRLYPAGAWYRGRKR